MDNKWKVAAQQQDPAHDGILFNEEQISHFSEEDAITEVNEASITNPVIAAATEKKSLGTRFSNHKKMAMTMGGIGLGLFMIGLAPFFLDSAAPNGLKGNLTQEKTDPLVAMFQNASSAEKLDSVNNSSASTNSSIPNFGDTKSTTSTTNSPSPVTPTVTPVATPAISAKNTSSSGLSSFDSSTFELERQKQAASTEVDRLLKGNNTFTETPVVQNTNIGTEDTEGKAFGGQEESLHGSAGLQNTSVATTTSVPNNAVVVKKVPAPKTGMSENIALGLAFMIAGFLFARRRTNE